MEDFLLEIPKLKQLNSQPHSKAAFQQQSLKLFRIHTMTEKNLSRNVDAL